MRQGPWKYRVARGEGIEGESTAESTPELYHLERDVAERYNQMEHEPAIAARMAARLREFAKELDARLAGAPI